MSTENISIQISKDPLDLSALDAHCRTEDAGGVVIFEGVVRNGTSGRKVQYLEFEAYESMALKEMNNIAQQILEKWQATRVAMYHRNGIVSPGEYAVLIGVSTPHRGAAFEACKYAIDSLKETVPIWKKEVFEDGEIWVSAHP